MTSSRINSVHFQDGRIAHPPGIRDHGVPVDPLSAQELSGTKGGLAGIVTDSSGAVVPGAGVTVTAVPIRAK